jgi:hypothetical protein
MIEVTHENTGFLTRISVWPTGKQPHASRVDIIEVRGKLEIVVNQAIPDNPTAPQVRNLSAALSIVADIAERRVQKYWPDATKKVVRAFLLSVER